MRFTVVWKPAAMRQLAELWLASPARREITSAVDAIDRALRVDPGTLGESRSDRERILFLPPVVVTFEVRHEDLIVEVLSVKVVRSGEKHN